MHRHGGGQLVLILLSARFKTQRELLEFVGRHRLNSSHHELAVLLAKRAARLRGRQIELLEHVAGERATAERMRHASGRRIVSIAG